MIKDSLNSPSDTVWKASEQRRGQTGQGTRLAPLRLTVELTGVQNRYTSQRNILESPEIDPVTCGHLICDKGSRLI